MSVFGAYARYYDLLYRDKDYAAEVEFIASLLQQYAPSGSRILELGCGTGIHAERLALRGYSIHGIDLSEEMLATARHRTESLPVSERLTFDVGNVRTYKAGHTFDIVLSLFHVVSYQASNDELRAMFQNAAEHLEAGGVFIFDFWHGPAVLTERPSVRVKRMESEEIVVTRVASPTIDLISNQVDVHYDIFIRDKKTAQVEELSETHRMRYLFLTEIEMLARDAGLKFASSFEWMTSKAASEKSWGVCAVLTK
ncbi:class I SAM-dependent methyltransferase [Herbaspirillum frisingense]|uniref:class I SAM-dependent DNA methyltransferase n=1 Tax=Herbaspirillum frisingense TaxID=92645 RepID=UPI0016020D4E|nr:class I SAM-dependent methyltransferase [Herbaspirillum frisingense]QNB05734.1 class I SAM-dependent methyltransferase [Herbaspirillum frisingense]